MEKLQYEKLLEQNKINLSDLPAQAQVAIKEVKKKMLGVNMREKSGKNISASQKQSLEYADAQASREIQAFLDEKSSQEGKPQPKNKPDEVDSKNLESKEIDVKKGHAIEKELEKIVSSGKKEILLEELKQLAPESYEVIFSNYKKGEQNGIETTRYNVLEKENEPEKFVVSKI